MAKTASSVWPLRSCFVRYAKEDTVVDRVDYFVSLKRKEMSHNDKESCSCRLARDGIATAVQAKGEYFQARSGQR